MSKYCLREIEAVQFETKNLYQVTQFEYLCWMGSSLKIMTPGELTAEYKEVM